MMQLVNADIDKWTAGRGHDDDLTMIVIKIQAKTA